MGGTAWGNFIWKIICGVLGSDRGSPATTVIIGTVMENGFTSGPTISTTSPAANLLRSDNVALPSESQSVTTAQICQSRI